MIISVSGLIGSGKDTVADILVEKHGFVRESWAGIVKDVLSVMFGWNREWLEGRTPGSREWREQPDEWWTNRLGFTVSPRSMMQQIATEVMRDGFHDEIWVACLENKLRGRMENIVISDTRFENELASVKRLGGISVRVVRGVDPQWVVDYKQLGPTGEFLRHHPNIHASEYSSVSLSYDHVIENNSSLEELEEKVSDLIQYRRCAM